ncbi:MAG: molybdenum cofactor guanylyltransferase [Spirochaetes bacterium]|nr:molybdenum cofactor guanylyltransferase [Spirochaetota bacterium]
MSRTNTTGRIGDMEAFIIAGGKGRRFGGDKLLHPYRGKPLVRHAVDIIHTVFTDVSIIATGGERFGFLGIPCYPDLVDGVGPLAGIYTALSRTDRDRCFIVGGDMPRLDAGFIRHLAGLSRGYDVTVPVVNGEFETLHAVYSKQCLGAVRDAIESGEKRIVSFFGRVRVLKVGEAEIARFGRPDEMFRNINFRNDLDDDLPPS